MYKRQVVDDVLAAVDVEPFARRAPSRQILDRRVKQQRGLRDAQLLPPLAFLQGVVVQHGSDGPAFDGVLLTELVEIEKRAPAVGLDPVSYTHLAPSAFAGSA